VLSLVCEPARGLLGTGGLVPGSGGRRPGSGVGWVDELWGLPSR
jgi:hypothetical protein